MPTTQTATKPRISDPGITRLASVAAELDRAAALTGITLGSASVVLGRWPQVDIHGLTRPTHAQAAAFLRALGVAEIDSRLISRDGMLGGPMDALTGVWDGIKFTVYAEPGRVAAIA